MSGKVWLVWNNMWDWNRVFAIFSTEKAARDYKEELESNVAPDDPDRDALTIECRDVDPDRSTIPGAWDVQLDIETDELVFADYWMIEPNALYQIQTDPGSDRPIYKRATGLTRDEAIARAKTVQVSGEND